MPAGADPAALASHLDLRLDVESQGTCCAALYENPGVRWVLGDELHPGGAATTRRALELIALGPGDRLLDVGCGFGQSVLVAARERESEATGVDLGASAIANAQAAADAQGLSGRAAFVCGDATALPFRDESFDAVLAECALSTYADKERAAQEMRRVLRPGGRAAISDVVVDRSRLPAALRGPLAALACVGAALDADGYAALLGDAGMRVDAVEHRDADVARLAQRVEDRLRGARVLGFGTVDQAIELVRVARPAIAEGALGYAIFSAVRE